MLLRSTSTPILNSWLRQHCIRESSPEPEFQVLQRTRSLSLSNPLLSPPQSTSESNLQNDLKKQKKYIRPLISPPPPPPPGSLENQQLENSSEPSKRLQRLFSSSGLGEKLVLQNDNREEGCSVKDGVLQTMAMGGGAGNNGGKICGGGGGGGDDDDSGGDHGSGNNYNHGSNSTDVYYQKMIEANPGNALLLGNYAKFLKEVKGDYAKAEELCGRAILANPDDGNNLALYADLIWKAHKDSQRAENYFDQAVKTAPDDCYVLASYARFLWDAEEEDDEEGQREGDDSSHMSPPNIFHGATPHHLPLTAA